MINITNINNTQKTYLQEKQKKENKKVQPTFADSFKKEKEKDGKY